MNYFFHPLGSNYNNIKPSTYGGHQSGAALDFIAAEGTPVYSMSDGIVTWAGRYGNAGPSVIIKNTTNGFTTLYDNNRPLWFKYLHLIDVTVEEGQQISPGTLLGHIGWLKGSANGVSHLHLDISEVPNDDVRDYTKIVDVTGNSGDPPNLKFLMSNYNSVTQDTKGFAASAGIGNRYSYIFTIFNQEVVSVAPSVEVDINFYNMAMNNNNNFSYDELTDMVAGLCVREIGVSLDGPEYTLSSWCLYAKLIRNRLLNNPNNGIYGVLFAPNQFSGADTANTRYSNKASSVSAANLDFNTTKEYILANFSSETTYGILPEHLIGYKGQNLAETVYYNYGYSGENYSNTKNNEEAIKQGIKNGSLPSHISWATLSKVIGNTAFFE